MPAESHHSRPLQAHAGALRVPGVVAAFAAAALAATVCLVPSAGAATPAVSQSRGQFLSGSIASMSLDTLAAIAPENAANFGGPTVTKFNSLDVSALDNAVKLPLSNALQLPGGGVASFGAVNQYAQALSDGSAHGASGAVNNSGGIGIGGQNGSAPSSATFDLAGFGGPSVASTLGDLKLTLGAISAKADQAAGSDGAQTGRYQIAGLTADLTSPALKKLITPAAASITSQLQGMATQFNTAAKGVVAIEGTDRFPDVAKELSSFSTPSHSITGDLMTGSLHIDLAKLLADGGLDLNNLPPNTHLLPYLSKALATGLPKVLTTVLSTLQNKLDASVNGLGFKIAGNALDASQVTALLDPTVQQIEANLNAPLTAGGTQLGGVFGTLANQFSSMLDVIVNGQSNNGGTFTESAISVLLGGSSGANIVLASASVGPSSVSSIDNPPPPQAAANPPAVVPAGKIKIDAGGGSTGGSGLPIAGLAGIALLIAGGAGLVARRLRSHPGR